MEKIYNFFAIIISYTADSIWISPDRIRQHKIMMENWWKPWIPIAKTNEFWNFLIGLRVFIVPILLFIFVWNILIFPYRFYKKFQKMSPEEKTKIYPLIIIENKILIWIWSIFLARILIEMPDIYSEEALIKYEVWLLIFLIVGIFHYFFNLTSGIFIYIKKDKIIWRRIMIKINIFLILFLAIYWLLSIAK